MKTKTIYLLFVNLVLAQICFAAVLGYDPQNSEQPNALDANWTMGGTTNPISGFYGDGTIAGLNVTGSDKGYWYYDNAGLTSSGYTVDFRVLVDSDADAGYFPVQILLYDSGELIQIKLGAQEGVVVQQEGGGTRASDAAFDTTAYHTYRYIRDGLSFSVYVDNDPTPLFVGSILDLNNVTGFDRVFFGRGGSDAKGTAAIDYIIWDNSQAFAEPPIPSVGGYDPYSSQQPDEIDSGWILSGSTNPISAFYGGGEIAGLNISGSDKGLWYYDAVGLSLDPNYTIDFKAFVDYDSSPSTVPVQILVYDSGELVFLELGVEEGVRVRQEGVGTVAQNTGIITNDTYHIYRYVKSVSGFEIYMDNIESPILAGTITNNDAVAVNDRIAFGRGDSYGAGTSGLDYILWNTTDAFAEPPITSVLGYDPQNSEQPDDLDPLWAMGGTTNPIATFYGGGSIAGLSVSGTDKGYWYYDGAGLTVDSDYTVYFKALVDSDSSSSTVPVQILLYDGGELVYLELGAQEGVRIRQEGEGIIAQNTSVITNDAYHVYRYVRSGFDYRMYQDDDPIAILSGTIADNDALSGYDRVLFGRADTTAGGSAGLDYLIWDNSVADFIYRPEDLNKDFEIDFEDFAVLGDQWLDCTSPDSPCGYNAPEGQTLFRDTFDGTSTDLDANNWNWWEGPGTDNIRTVNGRLIADGSISGTWRGWNIVGMASKASFSNPIANPGSNDKLYMYLWNVRTLNTSTNYSHPVRIGFGVEGKSYDPVTQELITDDRVLRDASGYVYWRIDDGASPETYGEVWPYGRVARPGELIAEDLANPGTSIDYNDVYADYRIIMDGQTDGVLVQVKPVGSDTWTTTMSEIYSGFDWYDANMDGDLDDPEDYLGTERIDDDPLYVNLGGAFLYLEIDEVYVALNRDITKPAPLCGDQDHPYTAADFNEDCYVNFADLEQFVEAWLNSY